MVFNGEVYNYKEIRGELDEKMNTTSDTEVVLEAFAKWGSGCLEKLNGMFALVIYDKEQHTLFLARDRLGIKPLYYYWDGRNLAFASELKGLLQLNSVVEQKTINSQSLSNFLYLGYVPEPDTIYKNIYKFPAGAYTTFNGKELDIKPYWKLEDKVELQVISDLPSAKTKFRELITSSVKYRLIADVPYGSFLSGGTDSSLVTAVAQDILTQPIKTFSIGFKEAKYNEAHYARAVAEHLKTDHHELILTNDDALNLFDDIIQTYDEPFGDSSSVPTMLVSKFARQHVTMTLSGDGGDELFLGYGFYQWAKRLSNPFIQAFRKPIGFGLSKLDNRMKRAAHLFQYPTAETIKSHIFSQEQYYFSASQLDSLMAERWNSTPYLPETFPTFPRNLNPAEEQALFDMKFYLKDDLLTKVDRASMKYSLESRVPLLDHRLVEFALNVDQQLKMNGSTSKYLLKELLYEYVPREIFDRPKWGFGMPISIWLKNELKCWVDEFLDPKLLNDCGLVKPEVVESYKSAFFGGKDYFYNRIWLLVLLHKWYVCNF